MTENVSEQLERLLRSTHPYPQPGSGFDPMTASNVELAGFGLPERPDATTAPEHFRFWQAMLKPPNTFVAPVFPTANELIKGRDEHELDLHGIHAPLLRQVHHRRSSRNWSGAYITPIPRPNRFMQMAGTWTVPQPEVPRVQPSGTDRTDVAALRWRMNLPG